MASTVRPRPSQQTTTPTGPGRAEDGGAQQYASDMGPYNPLKSLVPVRADPSAPDKWDSERIGRYSFDYSSQSNVLLVRDRQIEYNVRMVCGQQWNVWHPTLGRFFDVSDWLSNDEKAWRKLPVINKLMRWFTITHARLTENPPMLNMLPGPDRIDAEAAEVYDTLFKKDWRDAGMESVHDEIVRWMVMAGRAHAISRIDPSRGEWKPWIASAPLTIVDDDMNPVPGPDGQPMQTPEPVPNVPISADGTPNAVMHVSGQMIPLGPPHMERTGAVAVDVYSPLQVRAQWGPQLWHDKQWHCVQRFLTPEQVFDQWGVEIEPDISQQAAVNIATLERVLYGAGFYGTAMGRLGTGWVDSKVKGALCTVYQRWDKPLPYDERLEGTWAEALVETPTNPGGREMVWTPKAVIRDGARAVAWPHVSPIRCFDFVRLPGRPSGTTPLETLLGPQRSYNQNRSQVAEQAALLGNPQIMIDEDSGIQPDQLTNAPGKIYTGARRPGVPAIEIIEAPGVSTDVIKAIQFAAEEIDELGGLRGTEGQSPTEDASGELVKELRFNSDRLLGSTARSAVKEYARMGEDWLKLYPIIYTEETIISINGADNLAETITVLPAVLHESKVNVEPDVESMLPEGRGERQQRAYAMWKDGLFGDPLGNEARDIFLELSRFPNYTRMAKPGGVDTDTARQENGKILMGELNQPVLEWYDHAVHLIVHEKYMKRPEFLKQPEIVQQAFAFHRMQHILMLQQQMAPAAQAQAALAPQGAEPGAGGGQPPEGGGGPPRGGGAHPHGGPPAQPQSTPAGPMGAMTPPSQPRGL